MFPHKVHRTHITQLYSTLVATNIISLLQLMKPCWRGGSKTRKSDFTKMGLFHITHTHTHVMAISYLRVQTSRSHYRWARLISWNNSFMPTESGGWYLGLLLNFVHHFPLTWKKAWLSWNSLFHGWLVYKNLAFK